MSAIQRDQLDNASKFMTAFWKEFVKPYYNPERSDEYWNQTYAKMDELSKKYCSKDERLMQILMGFWTGLEREVKKENGR